MHYHLFEHTCIVLGSMLLFLNLLSIQKPFIDLSLLILGINTEVSEWLVLKNEEYRGWLEKSSFANWDYETDLSKDNAQKVRGSSWFII